MKFLIFSTLLVSSLAIAGDKTYEFESPFIDGKSDVVYDGQIARQVLINSLKNLMDSPKSFEKNEAGNRTDVPKGGFEIGEIGQSREESAYNVLNTYVKYIPFPESDESEVYGGFYAYTPLYFQTLRIEAGPLKVVSSFEYNSADNALDEEKLVLDYVFLGSTADLNGKLAGIDNELFHGSLLGFNSSLNSKGFYVYKHNDDEESYFKDKTYENTPKGYLDYLLSLWAEDAGSGEPFVVQTGGAAAQRVEKVGVLKNGWDVTQLTQKFLYGAISFSQSARDYLSTDLGESKGLNASNENPSEAGSPYTALAHHWDEAFGYFGASKDYLSFKTDEVLKGLASDINGDNEIDLRSEVNFGISINAVKRDEGSLDTENFAESIYLDFLKGRTLISQKPEGYREEIKSIAQKIISQWERLFAANVIHYINKTSDEYERLNSDLGYSFIHLAKYWSEMKGFALAFQFNPKSVMSVENFEKLHSLLRAEPELNEASLKSYKNDLKEARLMLVKIYDFNELASESM